MHNTAVGRQTINADLPLHVYSIVWNIQPSCPPWHCTEIIPFTVYLTPSPDGTHPSNSLPSTLNCMLLRDKVSSKFVSPIHGEILHVCQMPVMFLFCSPFPNCELCFQLMIILEFLFHLINFYTFHLLFIH